MPYSSTPWPEIEAEYVSGPDTTSQAVIAAKYGLSERTVQGRSRRHDWAEKRATYRAQATAAALQQSTVRMADRVVDINESFASRFERAGLAALDLVDQADAPGDKRNLMVAAAVAYDKVRLALGLHTDSQRLETIADGKLDEKLAQVVAQLTPEVPRPQAAQDNEGEPTEGES